MNFALLITGLIFKRLASLFLNSLGNTIRSFKLKILFKVKNLSLPLLELIKVIKGLPKIIENIVPWKESVRIDLHILMEYINFSIYSSTSSLISKIL